MAQDNAERFPTGRTALGGAACGLTYDGALQDAVARESRLRRPLRLPRWPDSQRPASPAGNARREVSEAVRADLSV